MYNSYIWPMLSCIFATAHTVSSKVMPCSPSAKIFQRLRYKDQLKTHSPLTEVSLLP